MVRPRNDLSRTMTQALCLHCGQLKFGALVACAACRHPADPRTDVNLLFSSHTLQSATLKALQPVVSALHRNSANHEQAVHALLRYVARRQPNLVTLDAPHAEMAALDDLLARAGLPEVLFRAA